MSDLIALTRGVSPELAACELTHAPRVPIDVARAVEQHLAYERALQQLGCTLHRLPAGEGMADAVFVEDTAVVLPEIAIVMRPGAESRRPETAAVEEWLTPRFLMARIEPPGTMDGGDVVVVGQSVFVGATSRTNEAGRDQLRAIVEYFGYSMAVVEVQGCLHLKSAVTSLADEAVLINPRWAPAAAFVPYQLVEVHHDEPAAANVVRIGGELLYSAAFPRTLARIREIGAPVTTVDVSELAKAEGAVTCCSIIFTGNKP